MVSKGRFPRGTSISVAWSGPVRVRVCVHVGGGGLGGGEGCKVRVKGSTKGKF